MEHTVSLVTTHKSLRGYLFVVSFFGLIFVLGIFVSSLLKFHVEFGRKWVAFHVCVRKKHCLSHDVGWFRKLTFCLDTYQVGISCLDVLLHLITRVVHMI